MSRRKVLTYLAVAGLIVLLGAAAATALHWSSLRWRWQLISSKATGGIPELSWSELGAIIRPGGRFSTEDAIEQGRSLEAALLSPYSKPEDLQHGADLFRQRCSVCHGSDARGGRGPSLVERSYRNGDSDLSIYRVLRDGVPGTAMIPTGLSAVERWQMVSYLRSLRRAATSEARAEPKMHVEVSDEDLRDAGARADEWLTYSRSFSSQRFVNSAQITPDNVSHLRLRWARQLATNEMVLEGTPLVANGVLFIAEPSEAISAINVKTGERLWRYERHLPEKLPLCCGRVNRGLAIISGTLFLGTLDGHLVALNASSGEVKWDVPIVDPAKGYSLTGAPLGFGHTLVVGISGGEFGVRGFLAAYDPSNGHKLWQFDTIPAPGAKGHETWKSDAWKSGGGPTWMTGSYDREANLIYWGVGNPSPVYAGDLRPGDNLFTNSVIALHPDTGQLAWYFQFSPHDEHDWDSSQTPILAEVPIGGTPRKVILWANRNGFFYILDRLTGEFLGAKPFVKQNWAQGIDSHGRPILAPSGQVTEKGGLTFPGVGGGVNWQAPAFDPHLQLFFVHATESSSVFTKSPPAQVHRTPGQLFVGSGAASVTSQTPIVRALAAGTGDLVWEYHSPPLLDFGLSGLLATQGNLVFGCAGGFVFALDSRTGAERWRTFLVGTSLAPPISVEIDGQQTLLVTSGLNLFAFGL